MDEWHVAQHDWRLDIASRVLAALAPNHPGSADEMAEASLRLADALLRAHERKEETPQ